MRHLAGAICRLLAVLLLLPLQTVQAGMVSTGEVSAADRAEAARALVLQIAGRADIASRLQAMGVDREAAQQRVAAMTDSEVQSFADRIDTLPAGANTAYGWGVAVVLIILVISLYLWQR
jgi:uncharacterized protein DUF6627